MGWIECHGGDHSKQSNFIAIGFLSVFLVERLTFSSANCTFKGRICIEMYKIKFQLSLIFIGSMQYFSITVYFSPTEFVPAVLMGLLSGPSSLLLPDVQPTASSGVTTASWIAEDNKYIQINTIELHISACFRDWRLPIILLSFPLLFPLEAHGTS